MITEQQYNLAKGLLDRWVEILENRLGLLTYENNLRLAYDWARKLLPLTRDSKILIGTPKVKFASEDVEEIIKRYQMESR